MVAVRANLFRAGEIIIGKNTPRLASGILISKAKALRSSPAVCIFAKTAPSTHIFWKDKNGVYLGCNDVFCKSLSLSSPEEIIGKTDYDLLVDKKESDAYRLNDKEVMASRKSKLNIEEYQTLSNGDRTVLLTSKIPLSRI